jgi:hypothetical protein
VVGSKNVSAGFVSSDVISLYIAMPATLPDSVIGGEPPVDDW